MAAQFVKIFGERNTGTRALNALLRQIPDVVGRVQSRDAVPPIDGAVAAAIESEMKGHWKRLYLHALRDDIAARHSVDEPWKHACPRLTPSMIDAGVRTLLLVRNPYSWLIGLARRPYHMKGPHATSLESFAARPWMTERREGLPAVVASPLDLWSRKAAGTLNYADTAREAGLHSATLRFEDFVLDPASVATEAFRQIDLVPPDLSPRSRNTKMNEASLEQLQTYYRTEAWRCRLTRETVARINQRVDWQIAEQLGYPMLDPADFPQTLSDQEARAMEAEMANLTTPSHMPEPSHREAGTAPAA
ncbi:MAG: hypothetical protein AAFV27_06790 [Pseudomonadota bacterium]